MGRGCGRGSTKEPQRVPSPVKTIYRMKNVMSNWQFMRTEFERQYLAATRKETFIEMPESPRKGFRRNFTVPGLSRPNSRKIQDKCASFSHDALHGDRSAHHLNQPSGNRQPKTGVAILFGNSLVMLLEKIENPGLGPLRNSDPGVLDPNGQIDHMVGRVRQQNAQPDKTVLGEFNRVAKQVEQHLPRADLIHQQLAWNPRAFRKGNVSLSNN